MKTIKNTILLIISLIIISVISPKSMATLASTTWTDEETGYTFNISVNEEGKVFVVDSNENGQNRYNGREEYLKYRAAKIRAAQEAQEMNNDSNQGNNQSEQEERTETSETQSEIIKIGDINLDGLTKGGIAAGNNVFCIEHYNNNIAETTGKNVIIVDGTRVELTKENVTSEGIVIGTGKVPKYGKATVTDTQPSQGRVLDDVIYREVKEEILGETYESAATAYISSKVQDANDNGSGLENNMQIAIWNDDYYELNNGQTYGKFDGGLLKEAEAYQNYRKEIEEWKRKGKVVEDVIIDETVSTDIAKGIKELRTIYNRLCERICQYIRKRICRLWRDTRNKIIYTRWN